MTTEFLWAAPRPPTRGPKPALDLARITETAVAVADAENLAAVSMQRVAAELGYTKMSLYRYLPGKAELVALMIEHVMGAPPSVAAAPWRDGLKTWARRLFDALLRHPWTLEAVAQPRPVGPNEMDWMEAALGLLLDTGLNAHEQLDTVAVLAGHVRAIAQQARAGQHAEADLVTAVTIALGEHGDRYPAIAATMSAAATSAAATSAAATSGGPDQALDFGLDRILDGLQVLMDRRVQGRRGSAAATRAVRAGRARSAGSPP